MAKFRVNAMVALEVEYHAESKHEAKEGAKGLIPAEISKLQRVLYCGDPLIGTVTRIEDNA